MSEKEIVYKPCHPEKIPRYAGISTFMRLPCMEVAEAIGADIGLIGVPWDGGTTTAPARDMAPAR